MKEKLTREKVVEMVKILFNNEDVKTVQIFVRFKDQSTISSSKGEKRGFN